VIDFSTLKTSEEKLLTLFFTLSNKPRSQKQIYTELKISERGCRVTLNSLIQKGFLEKSINEHGIVLYYSIRPVFFADQPAIFAGQPADFAGQPAENSAQLTNPDYLKLNKQINKQKIFEEGEKGREEKAASEYEPMVRTSLVHKPTPKPPQTARRDDMPSIALPMNCPDKGDFDGYIFAAEFPRKNALDRMLALMGADTPTKHNVVIKTRYELFRRSLDIIFNEFTRIQKGKQVYDDVVQRFAFAAAMEVSSLKTLNELYIFLADVKEDYKNANSRIYVWTPALQTLRQIYFNRRWGWAEKCFSTRDTWDWEVQRSDDNHTEPRIELFPARRHQLEQAKRPKRLTPKQYERAEQEKIKQLSPNEAFEMWVKCIKTNPNNFIARNNLIQNYGITPEQLQMILDAPTLEEAFLITPNTLELVTA
jgi:hypothetical protein